MLNQLKHKIADGISWWGALRDNAECRKLCQNYQIPGGYQRIYHYHIRKTAGTSVNHAFFNLGTNPQVDVHKYFFRAKRGRQRVIGNGLIFVAYDRYLIRQGLYWYGCSHFARHEAMPPANTFTFTILRDPLKRLVSYYRMLMEISRRPDQHPLKYTECRWLGNSFGDFLERIPREHLDCQLFTFSQRYSVDEALQNLLALNAILMTENIVADTEKLAQTLKLQLNIINDRKSRIEAPISDAEMSRAREMLSHEYDMLAKLKQARP